MSWPTVAPFVLPLSRGRPASRRWLAAVVCVALVGCDAANSTNNRGDLDATLGDSEWAIVLDMLVGPNHGTYAGQRVRELTAQAGFTGFWAVNEGTRSLVYFGRYDSPTDPQAQRDQAKLRRMADAGRLDAATVALTPVRERTTGELNPMDLRTVARNPGAIYTLQVGYYDRQFGEDFRQAAEKAAQVYRDEGAEAYFYHGPNRSLVTIGVFGRAAARADRTGKVTYHPHIEQLRETYPYNLGNGLTLIETDLRTGKQREQPSFLVKIPK